MRHSHIKMETHHCRLRISRQSRTLLKCHRRWQPSLQHRRVSRSFFSISINFPLINFIFFLCSSVPHMTPLSSASVITTSTSGLATSNNNYPHLTPIVGNHHLYQQQNSSSSMMSSDYNNSPTCYQQSFPMNMLDAAIKVENGSSMLLTRQQSNESNNSDSKALDLELKPNRQLNTMTSIESR